MYSCFNALLNYPSKRYEIVKGYEPLLIGGMTDALCDSLPQCCRNCSGVFIDELTAVEIICGWLVEAFGGVMQNKSHHTRFIVCGCMYVGEIVCALITALLS